MWQIKIWLIPRGTFQTSQSFFFLEMKMMIFETIFPHLLCSLSLQFCCILTHPVYEVQSHSSLPDSHLFWFPVVSILGADTIHAFLQPSGGLIFLPVLLPLHKHTQTTHHISSYIGWDWGWTLRFETAGTLILELGFNMIYLMEPWMFSVHDASQVTLLSWRTSFHFVPGGGLGCFESLQKKETVWNMLTTFTLHMFITATVLIVCESVAFL